MFCQPATLPITLTDRWNHVT